MKPRIELVLLTMVAIVSSYHVIIQFGGADAMAIAIVQGVALSAMLAYFAHSVATKKGWQKAPALIGLAVFATFSATFQTIHFLEHGASMWEAVARGCWAPVAELLLGLLLVQSVSVERKAARGPSRWDGLLDAGVGRLTAQLEQPPTVQPMVPEPSTVPSHTVVEPRPEPVGTDDRLKRIEDVIGVEPFAGLETISAQTGVPKSTVGRLLKSNGYHKNGNGWEANGTNGATPE